MPIPLAKFRLNGRKLRETYGRYSKLHLRLFRNEFQKLIKSFEGETIHEARVQLKRLRFLYDWLGELYQSEFDAKERFKPYKKAFRSIGRIRDLQVMKHLSAGWKGKSSGMQAWIAFLDKRTTDEIDSTILIFAKRKLPAAAAHSKMISSLLQSKFESGASARIKKFFSQYSAAAYSLSAMENPEEIHDVRTTVKNCYYFLELHRDHPEVLRLVAVRPGQIRELGTLLGNWHDFSVLHETFLTFLKEKKLPKSHLAGFRKYLEEKSEFYLLAAREKGKAGRKKQK